MANNVAGSSPPIWLTAVKAVLAGPQRLTESRATYCAGVKVLTAAHCSKSSMKVMIDSSEVYLWNTGGLISILSDCVGWVLVAVVRCSA